MPKFSEASLNNLKQTDPFLQIVLRLAIHIVDFSVVCGHREKAKQNEACDKGYSKLRFPKSKHNSFPSMAVDIIPYPDGYHSAPREWYYLSGVVLGIASMITDGYKIEWGGHWKKFVDKPHFQLKKIKK